MQFPPALAFVSGAISSKGDYHWCAACQRRRRAKGDNVAIIIPSVTPLKRCPHIMLPDIISENGVRVSLAQGGWLVGFATTLCILVYQPERVVLYYKFSMLDEMIKNNAK
jgi:hypothetical protein